MPGGEGARQLRDTHRYPAPLIHSVTHTRDVLAPTYSARHNCQSLDRVHALTRAHTRAHAPRVSARFQGVCTVLLGCLHGDDAPCHSPSNARTHARTRTRAREHTPARTFTQSHTPVTCSHGASSVMTPDSASPLAVVCPRRSVPLYTLARPMNVAMRRVALPQHTSSSPVAMGSSDPAWPTCRRKGF
jgi:hypothetical protein